jgi:hypothetical protein
MYRPLCGGFGFAADGRNKQIQNPKSKIKIQMEIEKLIK